MALLEIALLGGFRARLPSGAALSLPAKKAQALLAYLAMPAGQTHPRDRLAALLWGDMTQPHARASLRQAIFSIRKALLPESPLQHDGGTVTLAAGTVGVDVARFEQLADEGTREALEGAAAPAPPSASRARRRHSRHGSSPSPRGCRSWEWGRWPGYWPSSEEATSMLQCRPRIGCSPSTLPRSRCTACSCGFSSSSAAARPLCASTRSASTLWRATSPSSRIARPERYTGNPPRGRRAR
jgi:hypothetical protein